jgi:hypothetical protein
MVATTLNLESPLLATSQNLSQANLTQIALHVHTASLPTTITDSYNINYYYVQIFLVFWTGLIVFGMLYDSREEIMEWWGTKRRKKGVGGLERGAEREVEGSGYCRDFEGWGKGFEEEWEGGEEG